LNDFQAQQLESKHIRQTRNGLTCCFCTAVAPDE
jgi:hypothetical protein